MYKRQHLYGLLELAKRAGLEKVYVHCFMDGRDVHPTSGKEYIEAVSYKHLKEKTYVENISANVFLFGSKILSHMLKKDFSSSPTAAHVRRSMGEYLSLIHILRTAVSQQNYSLLTSSFYHKEKGFAIG